MMKLLKKVSAFICAGAIACTAFAFSAFAERSRCIVDGGAISESVADKCEKLLDEASDKQDIEFMAIFINDSSYSDSMVNSLADLYSRKYANCAVMVNNSATRYTVVDINGKPAKRITSSKASKIANNYINPELKDNDVVAAVEGFIKGVKRYSSFISFASLMIGLVCFLILFLITYLSVKTKYKFHEKPNTAAYLEGGDLDFQVMEDVFVSEHTSRTSISSGGSGGGGGGGGGHSSGGGHY